ncbi:MAG: ABC transporter permease [Streptosporangiaceae bacterium]
MDVELAVADRAEISQTAFRRTWSRSTRSRQIFVIVGGLIVAVFMVAAIAPGLFTSTNPDALYIGVPLSPPGAQHWLGTDELGRDFFARVVYGARPSLLMSLIVVALGATLGTIVGVAAGLFGGWLDEVLMRVVDLFLSLPGFVLALALAAALGRGERSVVIALSVVWWPGYARLFRGMVLELKYRLHVENARALGAGHFQIARKHMLPFMWGQLNARVTQDLGYALVNVAGLSFVGLGAQPPTPEWGSLLQSGLQYVATAWWLTLFPGLAITMWTVGIAMLGDGLSGLMRGERDIRERD